MPGIRTILRRARGHLHNKLQVAALYFPVPSADPVDCTVRVHQAVVDVGALPGTGSEQFVDRREMTPRIVFRSAEIPVPRVNAIVSIEEGEAYRVVRSDPPDAAGDIYADVTRLSASEAAGLQVPC